MGFTPGIYTYVWFDFLGFVFGVSVAEVAV